MSVRQGDRILGTRKDTLHVLGGGKFVHRIKSKGTTSACSLKNASLVDIFASTVFSTVN